MVYNENLAKAFIKRKGIVKILLKYWTYNHITFKRRSHLNYPISQFKRGIKIRMMLLNKLYSATDTNHMN